MYLILLLLIIAGVAVADFALMTNFTATLMMVVYTALVCLLHYFTNTEMTDKTPRSYQRGLFRSKDWYTAWYINVKVAVMLAVLGILFILFCWYMPNGYSVNVIGLLGAVGVLVVAASFAHFVGTLNGLQR